MDEVEQRVLSCFRAVFPDVESRELTVLDQATHPVWDSVAHVTLVAALEETFEHPFDFEAFHEATTYGQLVAVVKAQLPRA